MKLLYQYTITLVIMLGFDAVWLTSMSQSFYKKYLGHLFADQINWIAAGIFYPLYALGVYYFVVRAALLHNYPLWKVLTVGALFGLIAYATYDLTNHTTLKQWPTVVTIVDMIWGTCLTGLVALISVSIIRHWQ